MPESRIVQERVELSVSDGTRMSAYVARPGDRDARSGIIVLQEAFGVNSHIRNVADRFAREGYLAVAPELFHRTAPGFEGDYNNFPSVAPHMKAMTVPGAEADLRAAYEWLLSQKLAKQKIFSVGFCMGGRMSYLANSILPLEKAGSFYGGGIAPDFLDRAPNLHGRMLFFWGGLDKHITAEKRRAVADALTAAGKPFVHAEFSNADHGFFCDERSAYHPQAAKEAWTLMQEFLKD